MGGGEQREHGRRGVVRSHHDGRPVGFIAGDHRQVDTVEYLADLLARGAGDLSRYYTGLKIGRVQDGPVPEPDHPMHDVPGRPDGDADWIAGPLGPGSCPCFTIIELVIRRPHAERPVGAQ